MYPTSLQTAVYMMPSYLNAIEKGTHKPLCDDCIQNIITNISHELPTKLCATCVKAIKFNTEGKASVRHILPVSVELHTAIKTIHEYRNWLL